MKMRQYRGKTKEGKWVYGWYFTSLSGRHYIKSFYKGVGKVTRPPETTQLNRTVEHVVIPESVGIEVCGQWFSEEELSKIVKKGLEVIGNTTDNKNLLEK